MKHLVLLLPGYSISQSWHKEAPAIFKHTKFDPEIFTASKDAVTF
jgi:hypothetical protein